MIAVVPIDTPLLSGPATIATLLLLAGQFPIYAVSISFIPNLLIAWLLFLPGNPDHQVHEKKGPQGSFECVQPPSHCHRGAYDNPRPRTARYIQPEYII